jgi:hypothetical protein
MPLAYSVYIFDICNCSVSSKTTPIPTSPFPHYMEQGELKHCFFKSPSP